MRFNYFLEICSLEFEKIERFLSRLSFHWGLYKQHPPSLGYLDLYLLVDPRNLLCMRYQSAKVYFVNHPHCSSPLGLLHGYCYDCLSLPICSSNWFFPEFLCVLVAYLYYFCGSSPLLRVFPPHEGICCYILHCASAGTSPSSSSSTCRASKGYIRLFSFFYPSITASSSFRLSVRMQALAFLFHVSLKLADARENSDSFTKNVGRRSGNDIHAIAYVVSSPGLKFAS
ncbi:hypothetical protein KY284_023571 [Solanum tuberosum]|nr:hypothetical protein KY284_023571 [Solanum tuberosum]